MRYHEQSVTAEEMREFEQTPEGKASAAAWSKAVDEWDRALMAWVTAERAKKPCPTCGHKRGSQDG